jgi:hypothetical protein
MNLVPQFLDEGLPACRNFEYTASCLLTYPSRSTAIISIGEVPLWILICSTISCGASNLSLGAISHPGCSLAGHQAYEGEWGMQKKILLGAGVGSPNIPFLHRPPSFCQELSHSHSKIDISSRPCTYTWTSHLPRTTMGPNGGGS